jgi:hypothetical protein
LESVLQEAMGRVKQVIETVVGCKVPEAAA